MSADLPPPLPALVWPGSIAARAEALALIETLNAELLSHDSATLTLERWCQSHGMAVPALVHAELVRGATAALPAPERAALALKPGESLRFRHVRLTCGPHLLSEADNWYVPERLTPEMNRLLDETDTPFGKAVRDLHFQRRTLSAALLWSPLPEGWDTPGRAGATPTATMTIPPHLIRHRAMLFTAAQLPFAEVVETYTSAVLAFPAPAP